MYEWEREASVGMLKAIWVRSCVEDNNQENIIGKTFRAGAVTRDQKSEAWGIGG